MMIFNLLVYCLSFFFIWYGSGLIIASVTKFSSKLKLSPFAFSFVFLGLLTSMPEFSVGLQAVFDHEAEIFVGNLLGGIVVLFLIVIPILAIVANGVSLKHELDNKMLLATLVVIIAPSVAILDKKVTNLEGAALVLMYLVLLFFIERKKGIFDKHNTHILDVKAYSYKDLLKTVIGIAIVFASSNAIVSTTEYFALFFNIAPFYISLIVVAIGTDLPELSLAIRSVVSSRKEIAMGDYIGAAAVSTFLFGLFTVFHNGEVLTISNFLVPFFFILVALSIFYILSRTKQYISRTHGILMVGLYVVFVLFQILG